MNEVRDLSLQLYKKDSPKSMALASDLMEKHYRLQEKKRATNVALLGVAMKHEEIAQDADHHNDNMAAQEKKHDDDMAARAKDRKQKSKCHNDDMAARASDREDSRLQHDETIAVTKLTEERRLLQALFDDFCRTTVMVFWTCVAFLFVLLLDYHWNHALDDFCSYAEQFNWLQGDWTMSFFQSWPLSYFWSSSVDSCYIAIAAASTLVAIVLLLMSAMPPSWQTVMSLILSLILLRKTSVSPANRAIFDHLFWLVVMTAVAWVAIRFVVQTQLGENSAASIESTRKNFPMYSNALWLVYLVVCSHAYKSFYVSDGEFA